MTQVTADTTERGLPSDAGRTAQRRRVATRVKDAREKLTSSGSGQRTFDIELLRVFAERRRAAAPVLAILGFGTAGMATLWVPLAAALCWLGLVLAAIAPGALLARHFLSHDRSLAKPALWQRRFVVADALQGMAWATVAFVTTRTDDPASGTFVMFVLLLVGAMAAMISASVPVAVYASLAPLALAILSVLRPSSHVQSLPVVILACGAQLYFLMLARRLYTTALDTLLIQAEKDALIVELEQSRLNSDEARRRAEEASLAKSRFLATMSHELRTPLNAILGFSEVMKGELFGAHGNPVYRDYSADIHASGQHLLRLINEILDLSRIEAGRYELNEEPIVLAHLVEECRHLLTLRAAKREIAMQELIEPDLPRLWADERAMRQVVLNLLSNAIKFTPQGGGIVLKVGWTAQGGQYVSIRDTGPGIPDGEIPTVMSSFGRGTLAQKNAEEGSGLGLPIVKGLVELHGGTFILRSKVREGTEAIVILPPARVMNALPQINPDGHRDTTPPRPGSRSAA